ncbi:type II toxin-antitoxin system death-on-curing family toxin [Megamonas hypermegale]|uniref:type II toxin-antitoxin system death-on-curing family toxin n=1 Tax=Megamonas hypermegale TaxID=158847 RepID=UPI00195BCEAC|nr:type II toxin-antitoxin system death-on-curing family toxin [Megamonas hypermegale]MBM6760479.1 type II toxin-antitoxin system death-on-curing family toxin [Megamonas hypermegale]
MNEEQQIINILLDDVLEFHRELTDKYTMESGIHDMNMLLSAINTPFQSFAGQDLYPTVFDKASRLCFGLAKNHPFNDGNKRTAVHTMLVYLYINDILLDYEQIELETVIIDVASGKMNGEDLSLWIESHVQKSQV